MKIKIKAAVVLNPHETRVIATVLARHLNPVKTATVDNLNKVEEKVIIEEFLNKRAELERRLDL